MRFISRTKVENILSLTLNGINILFCLLVIAACIYKCIQAEFSAIVMCIYGGYVMFIFIFKLKQRQF